MEIVLNGRPKRTSPLLLRSTTMAKPTFSSLFLPRGPLSFFYFFSLFFLLLNHFSCSALVHAESHFEGFQAEDDDFDYQSIDPTSFRSPPLIQSEPHTTKLTPSDPKMPESGSNPNLNLDSRSSDSDLPKTSPTTTTTFDFWDEDEFEGLPDEQLAPEIHSTAGDSKFADNSSDPVVSTKAENVKGSRSFTVKIVCGSFLIMFAINYFTGKRENENLALAWAAQFTTKNSIFEKNFSLLGVGEGGDDAPLLLKEGQKVFKFYASGRRYC